MGQRPNPEIGIYVVSDGEKVLYVGKCRNVVKRLRDHKYFNSLLWQAITRELPDSLSWEIEMVPVDVDEPANTEYFMRKAEAEQIRELRPLFNMQGNPDQWAEG